MFYAFSVTDMDILYSKKKKKDQSSKIFLKPSPSPIFLLSPPVTKKVAKLSFICPGTLSPMLKRLIGNQAKGPSCCWHYATR